MTLNNEILTPALPSTYLVDSVKTEPPVTPTRAPSSFSSEALGHLMESLKRGPREPGLILSPTLSLSLSSTDQSSGDTYSARGSIPLQTPSTTSHSPLPTFPTPDLSEAPRRFEHLLTSHQRVLLDYSAKYNPSTAQELDAEVYTTKEALVSHYQSTVDLLADVIAYNSQVRWIEERFATASQEWRETVAKEKIESDSLRLSLHESSELVREHKDQAENSTRAAERAEGEKDHVTKKLQIANMEKLAVERTRDGLEQQIGRLIATRQDMVRETKDALEEKRRMAEERDEARTLAAAATKEAERMDAELKKVEAGQEAARGLWARLGMSSNKKKLVHD